MSVTKKARNTPATTAPVALALGLGLAGLVATAPAPTPTPVVKVAPTAALAAVTVVHVTAKGLNYKPKNGLKPNADTWNTISTLSTASATITELLALVPQHADFVRYAVRQGWLAAV